MVEKSRDEERGEESRDLEIEESEGKKLEMIDCLDLGRQQRFIGVGVVDTLDCG